MGRNPERSDIEIQKAESDELTHAQTVNVGEEQHLSGQTFTIWTAMGIGHSITNTAITIMFGLASGVAFGGAPVFFYGFILMALVALCVAISLGELSSAFPHSGGQYFWVAELAPERSKRLLSYMTGITGWAGAVCTGASVCLAVPLIIFNMAILANPDFEYKPWMGFVAYQAVNLLAFTFNLCERVLPWVSRSLLGYTIAVLVIIFVSLLVGNSKKQSAENFFATLYNITGWNDGVAFMIGLNACNWGFSCLDAAVHLAEEIPQPRKNIPKALICTVALGSFTGILIIFALFFAATDLDSVVVAGTPSLQIFYEVFRGNASAAIGLQTLVTVSGAGAIIGIHTWQSRIAWSFSRDKGFPFHRWMSKVAPEPFGTPIWAHVWSCLWTSVLGCLYLGSSLAFNSLVAGSILLQYITYSTSVAMLLWYGRSNIRPGPFWFPKLGLVANIVTISWSLIALCFYSFPFFLPVQANQMNYVSCVVVGILIYALLYWVMYGRKEFVLPMPQFYG